MMTVIPMSRFIAIYLLLLTTLLPAEEIISNPLIRATLKRDNMSITVVASDNLIGFGKTLGELSDPNNFMPLTDSEAEEWKVTFSAAKASDRPVAELLLNGSVIRIGNDDYSKIIKLIASTIPLNRNGSANESITSWPGYSETVSTQQGDAPEPATNAEPASPTPSAPAR